jgi:hypothetical protein
MMVCFALPQLNPLLLSFPFEETNRIASVGFGACASGFHVDGPEQRYKAPFTFINSAARTAVPC